MKIIKGILAVGIVIILSIVALFTLMCLCYEDDEYDEYYGF